MKWSRLATLPIGAGNIGFDRFFEYAGKMGYSGDYTVEATAFKNDVNIDDDMLNGCFDKIRAFIPLN